MTYSEKLKDPRWQKKRLEILDRDKFTCRSCHDTTKTLHVHHLDYEKGLDPWDYPNRYLITLCEQCHEETTVERPKFEQRIVTEFRLNFHDTFMQGVAADVFEDYEDLKDLFYMLWEVKDYQHDLLPLINEFLLLKRKERPISRGVLTDMPCIACGEHQVYSCCNGSLLICKVCACETLVKALKT